jgi:HKD family nuclease
MTSVDSIAQSAGQTTLQAIDKVLQSPNVERIDAAVAYITSGGVEDLLKAIAARLGSQNSRVKKRWITSFDYRRTEPIALDAIRSFPASNVRIYDAGFCLKHGGCPRVPFHPKAFLIRSSQDDVVVAGSGNVSRSGLSRGVEAGLVVGIDRLSTAVEPTALASINALQAWFAKTWNAAQFV